MLRFRAVELRERPNYPAALLQLLAVQYCDQSAKAGGIAMMNRLRLIQRAVSLRDAEGLIQHPASMTHHTDTPEERAARGIAEGLVRLSVGLEGVDDILDDLMQALAAHNAEAA